jgi:hypothetical protein
MCLKLLLSLRRTRLMASRQVMALKVNSGKVNLVRVDAASVAVDAGAVAVVAMAARMASPMVTRRTRAAKAMRLVQTRTRRVRIVTKPARMSRRVTVTVAIAMARLIKAAARAKVASASVVADEVAVAVVVVARIGLMGRPQLEARMQA